MGAARACRGAIAVHQCPARAGEDDLTACRREARRLYVDEAVLHLEERAGVATVGVGGPEAVDLALDQAHVHERAAIGRKGRIRPVRQDAPALAGLEVKALDRVVRSRRSLLA